MAAIQHPTVPLEHAGNWIAWDRAMKRIVAGGTSPTEVLNAARAAGEPDPVLGKSPPANVCSTGAGPMCVSGSTVPERRTIPRDAT
jgi:hypothetical protein